MRARRTPQTGPENDSVPVPSEGNDKQRTTQTELVPLLGLVYGIGQIQNGLSATGTWIPLAMIIFALIVFVPWERGATRRCPGS